MTSCGPYSLATIIYEPNNISFIPVLNERTILGVLTKYFPATYKIINLAGFEKMYSSPYPTTLFVNEPLNKIIVTNLTDTDKNLAIQLLRSHTCSKKIDATALGTSNVLILKTMATPVEILIEDYGDKANGRKIVKEIQCSNGIIHVLQ